MATELHLPIGIPLPPGRMIISDEGDGDLQPLWLSDGPASAGLWVMVRAEHVRTGLWPLLLDSGEPFDSEFRPWGAGELFPERMSSPDAHDPAELLARWWKDYTTLDEEDDMLSPEERQAVTAPFGQLWPGLASSPRSLLDPDEMAAEYAEHFVARRPQSRLGLVVAGTGSDAITVAGWDGPLNYDNDTAKFSAVVRGWEQRFGARVVAVGPATLHLSVAAPPLTAADALLVAAEHFAFCPDNVWQSSHPYTLTAYSEQLIGAHCWEFWWD
ncbi:DUF4253 domain-containing protein [Kitasatospora sp. NBC_00070]|uniref:DUF4253 domain-containing protein n=1 Tax=Kitasatospora sp. NBC_00070 TaxID=2975962 RepID=UPI0032461DBC